jgi:hypothetical protein
MAEFERVPIRPRPSRNWLPTAGLALAACLVLAIVKPWDWSRLAGGGDPSSQPTFFLRPTEPSDPHAYDARLFGGREPDPAWELWPAGYVVQFGLAGPVKVHGQEGESPPPQPAATSASSSTPRVSQGPGPGGSAAATVAPVVVPPAGAGVVDLGTTDHLVALGINTPLDVRVETVRLFRVNRGRSDLVDIVRLPTLWESTHFFVIAPADPAEAGQPASWEPGRYRLELTTAFGDVRVVDLEVRQPAGTSN